MLLAILKSEQGSFMLGVKFSKRAVYECNIKFVFGWRIFAEMLSTFFELRDVLSIEKFRQMRALSRVFLDGLLFSRSVSPTSVPFSRKSEAQTFRISFFERRTSLAWEYSNIPSTFSNTSQAVFPSLDQVSWSVDQSTYSFCKRKPTLKTFQSKVKFDQNFNDRCLFWRKSRFIER